MMRTKDIVSRHPEVMGGTLVFAGTRVPVRTLTQHMEAGDPLRAFLEGFPTVSRTQVVDYLRLAERLVEYEVGDGEVVDTESSATPTQREEEHAPHPA